MAQSAWMEEALEAIQIMDENEEAYEAFENFIGLYLFNEFDGRSAEFTDYDNSVNDAIFEDEYDDKVRPPWQN